MSNHTVIETRDADRVYGFNGTNAIIDHAKYGRILICDAFGGQDSLRGGAVRWSEGFVCQLQPGDTFDDLDKEANDHGITLFQIVTSGNDESRPVLEWHGSAIEKIAKKCGLA